LKIKIPALHKNERRDNQLVVLLAAADPNPAILQLLSQEQNIRLKEAFTTQGLIQELPETNLVIRGSLIEVSAISHDLVQRTLEMSRLPVVSIEEFLAAPEEWIGRARLSSATKLSFLPPKQLNIVNWSGGVGKTTLAMTVCKRFVDQTGLPAALLELSMGGSALQARISPELPEFFTIATGKAEPATWNGVNLYPMDGRSMEVLWGDDPVKVQEFVSNIRKKHTLFVVDCFPGHPLFPFLNGASSAAISIVTTTPRNDAVMQAKRLLKEVAQPAYLVMNMTRSLADQAGAGADLSLPYNERWAEGLDARLADPLLALVYPGWNGRKQ